MGKSASDLVSELRRRVKDAGGNEVGWETDGVALHGIRRGAQALLTVTVLETTEETSLTRAFEAVFVRIDGNEPCVYGPVPYGSLEDSAWRIQYFVPLA